MTNNGGAMNPLITPDQNSARQFCAQKILSGRIASGPEYVSGLYQNRLNGERVPCSSLNERDGEVFALRTITFSGVNRLR